MIRILKLGEMTAPELAAIHRRAELDIDRALPIAQAVIDKIKAEGDRGVVEYARQFDYADATAENLKVTEAEFAAAWEGIEPAVKTAVEQAFHNIREVHNARCLQKFNWQKLTGGSLLARRFRPFLVSGYTSLAVKGPFPQ